MRILLALLLALLAGCASTSPLVVGSDLENRPFAWVDAEGQAHGRDVEMMATIGNMLEKHIVWKRLAFADLLRAVQTGEVDVVCATMGVSEERKKLVDFTEPYFVTDLAVVVKAGADAPGSVADLAEKKVHASAGTTSEAAVRALLPDSEGVFELGKAGEDVDVVAQLTSGAIDAMVMDGPAADALVETSAGALRRLPGRLAPERYSLAVRKGNETLRYELDRRIEALRRSGAFARWNAKFGLVESAP